MHKEYLGDSVYIELEDNTRQIRLYTDNGYGPENVIYLDEPRQMERMIEWREQVAALHQREDSEAAKAANDTAQGTACEGSVPPWDGAGEL